MTVLAASIVYTDIPAGTSVDIRNGLQWPLAGGAAPVALSTGSRTVDRQPIREPKIPMPGVKSLGPNDVFYNRILVEPAELALGNLLSSQTRTVKVWNGFLLQKGLSAFQTSNDAGINVSQPVAVPYAMKPLEELTYTFNITLEGSANIDANFQWTIDGANYTVRVTGSRIVVFPFGPNWRMGKFSEVLEFKTDVLRTFSGREQRRSLRSKPRRSFSYTMSVSREDSQMFDNLMWGWQNRIFAMPVWSDKAHTTTVSPQGATVINCNTTNLSFIPGGLAIIYTGTRTYEVAEIDAVITGSLRLVRGLQASWPVDVVVMPAVLGHLPTEVSKQRHTNNTLSATVFFTTDPTATDPYLPVAAAPTVYKGVDVLTRQPNWKGNNLSLTNEFQFDTLDTGAGKIVWDATESFPRETRQYPWLLSNRVKIREFRELLGRLRGKAKTLWIPSWHIDFQVVAPISPSDTAIRVKDNGFRTLVGTNAPQANVQLRLRDGRVLWAKVMFVSANGADTMLGLDITFSYAITLDMIHTLYLMKLNRLATDTIEITWQSTEVATVDTNFTTVLE